MSPGPGTCQTLTANDFVPLGASFHSIGGDALAPSPVNSIGMLPPGSNAGLVTANQQLSQLRADEVRLYLIALGVHPARLRAVGKGSSNLANPLDPAAAENRRVRVVTLE